ncbi:MAG: transcriptional repressor [Acidobacteria bacterium]|nr:MAG: transcriptional repressor [Acidobacteriota bacterium]
MVSKLRSRGVRMTPQRLGVLKTLAGSVNHPTVEEIYEQIKRQFPTVSLATVYKTVSLLKGLNEVLELGFPDASNRYDGYRPFPHPHVICVRCRKIMDPELVNLEAISAEMSRKTGYEIQYHRLDFFGICPECRKSG